MPNTVTHSICRMNEWMHKWMKEPLTEATQRSMNPVVSQYPLVWKYLSLVSHNLLFLALSFVQFCLECYCYSLANLLHNCIFPRGPVSDLDALTLVSPKLYFPNLLNYKAQWGHVVNTQMTEPDFRWTEYETVRTSLSNLHFQTYPPDNSGEHM